MGVFEPGQVTKTGITKQQFQDLNKQRIAQGYTVWGGGPTGGIKSYSWSDLVNPETGLTRDQELQLQGYPAGMASSMRTTPPVVQNVSGAGIFVPVGQGSPSEPGGGGYGGGGGGTDGGGGIQTSQNALQHAMTSLLNDITNFQSSASGTSTGTTNSSNASQAATPLQTFSQDLTAFQTALNSSNQDQIKSLANTLQNDISAFYQQQSTATSSINLTV